MRIDLVRAALGDGKPASDVVASGLYAWIDGASSDASLLYIGEARNVAHRTCDEFRWAEQFKQRRREGHSLWDSSGCGLAAVLSTSPDPRAIA